MGIINTTYYHPKFKPNKHINNIDVRWLIGVSTLLIFVCVSLVKAISDYFPLSPNVRYTRKNNNKPYSFKNVHLDDTMIKPLVIKLNYNDNAASSSNNNNSWKMMRQEEEGEKREEVIVLDTYADVYKSYRNVPYAIVANLEVSSRDFYHRQSDKWVTEECKPMKEWQKTQFPSCNKVHEVPMDDFSVKGRSKVMLLSHGFWRDVWKYTGSDGGKTVLKTMRYEHGFEERNYDRHRRDALATERLTYADHIVDIFAFCGNSGIFEYGSGGDVSNFIYDHNSGFYTYTEALKLSVDIALGLSQAHSTEGSDFPYATIAHTDITAGQFILIDGKFKLNDFNRCRFIRWNEKLDIPCTYGVGNNPGKYRSPEEYAYAPQTEKIDVYSMGNIFYEFLVRQWPFENLKEEEAQAKIMSGERPAFGANILGLVDKDPAVAAIVYATKWCWEQKLKDRPTSKQIYEFLNTEYNKISQS